MSDLYSISISALQAFQTAISVTGNNIANANTPGYARETVDLTAAVPQSNGSAPIGSGVLVAGISRAISQLSNNQLNTSQSTLGQLNGLQSYTSQVDNIIGTTAGGLTTALQNFYNAWSTVANDPTSTAARTALLAQAQSVASSFQSTGSQLQGLNTAINGGITADVTQINSLTTSIANLNKQITVAQASGGGQAPNDLLDQRDSLVSNLSKLVGITTTTDSNGSLSVFVGNGQPLVLQGVTTALTTVANPFNASQLEISTAANGANTISAQITSGDLGGLLAARSQAVNPTLNQVGQIATAFTQSVNGQQNAGLDLNGKLGANLFSLGAPQAISSINNNDATTAAVSVVNAGALTSNDYLLTYAGGAYTLTNAATGGTVAFTGNGTAGNPITADGLAVTLSGTPANGDQFLIQPTAGAAAGVNVALTNTAQIAAAGAVQTVVAATNKGGATISSGTVVNAANPALLTTTTIAFTSPTNYTINGAGNFAYTAGANIAQNGWQVAISGAPVAGDSFTVQSNVGATGDNRNALISANLQNQGVLSGGTVTINGSAAALVTSVGSQALQVNTAQTAQSAVNANAVAAVNSVSGVDLNQEAASLLQWQQAFQASAQALQIGNQTFNYFLQALRG